MHKLDLPADKLSAGPVMDRSCTDILCCLVFIVFIVGMVGCAGYGYKYGEPELLLTPWDYDGTSISPVDSSRQWLRLC